MLLYAVCVFTFVVMLLGLSRKYDLNLNEISIWINKGLII